MPKIHGTPPHSEGIPLGKGCPWHGIILSVSSRGILSDLRTLRFMKIRKKWVFPAMLAFLLVSCGGESKQFRDTLPPETMINMMTELRILEGRVSVLNLGDDSTRNLYKELEKRIFDKYQVDSLTYVKSYQYYLLRPQEALFIADAVIDSLKVRQQIEEMSAMPDQ